MGVKELTKMRFQYEFCYFTYNNHKADLTHCSTETLLHTLLTVHHFGKVLQKTQRNTWTN